MNKKKAAGGENVFVLHFLLLLAIKIFRKLLRDFILKRQEGRREVIGPYHILQHTREERYFGHKEQMVMMG